VPVPGAVDILAVSPAKPQLVKPEPAPEPEKPAPAKAPAAKKAEDAKLAAAETAADKKKPAKKGEPAEEADARKGGKKTDAKKVDAKKAETKKPSHPSRIWVQIGVGREKSAIAFDWRKFNKEYAAAFKGRQAYVSDMGQTNRMLVGPFETQKAASAFLAQLKKADFGRGFIWTSPAGQVVDPLSAK
jgi:SPOR domain